MSERANDVLSIVAWVIMGVAGLYMIVNFTFLGDPIVSITQRAIEFCGCKDKTCIITYTERSHFNEDTWRKLCWEEQK